MLRAALSLPDVAWSARKSVRQHYSKVAMLPFPTERVVSRRSLREAAMPRVEKARLRKRSERRKEQRHQRGLQYKCRTAEEWREWRELERARLQKVTEERRAAREAAGLGGKRGRPIDPASRRQQKLAEQHSSIQIVYKNYKKM